MQHDEVDGGNRRNSHGEDWDARLLRAASAVQDATHRAGEALDQPVTASQLRLVSLLAEHGDLGVTDASERLGFAVSTVSRIGDRLMAAGMIRRAISKVNRRGVVLILTTRGRRVAAQWDAARLAELRKPTADLTPLVGEPDASDAQPRRVATSGATGEEDSIGDLVRALANSAPELVGITAMQWLTHRFDLSAAALYVERTDLDGMHQAVGWPQDAAIPRSFDSTEYAAAVRALHTQAKTRSADGREVYLPVTAPAAQIGVLALYAAESVDFNFASDDDAEYETVAALLGIVLPTVTAGSRWLELAGRAHEWTVAAEMQARQLPGHRLGAHGVVIGAHIEPAYDVNTDAYDFEIVADPVTGSPMIDVALLDCRSSPRDAPSVSGLALAALRHARTLGLDPAAQADLVSQALWAHFRGRAVVDVLLLRLTIDPWTVGVLATPSTDVYRHSPEGVHRLAPLRQPALGETEDASYVLEPLDLPRGHRLLLSSDGLLEHADAGTIVDLLRDRHREAPQTVVRLLMTDLRERAGPDGLEQDATAIYLHT